MKSCSREALTQEEVIEPDVFGRWVESFRPSCEVQAVHGGGRTFETRCESRFFLATAGQWVCRIAGGPTPILGPGDAIFFSNRPTTEAIDGTAAWESDPGAELLCGSVELAEAPWAEHLNEGPWPWLVPAASETLATEATWLRQAVAERRTERKGWPTIVSGLVTLTFVRMLRERTLVPWSVAPGWLKAIGDPDLNAVVMSMLREPDRPWTVETLATVGAVSRATFARRFRATTGFSPIEALTEIRMHKARMLLRRGHSPKEVSRRVGYSSPSSFSTAYARYFAKHRRQDPTERNGVADDSGTFHHDGKSATASPDSVG